MASEVPRQPFPVPGGRGRLRTAWRMVIAGIVTNMSLATLKLLAGLFGSSHALIADAVESFSDVISSCVALGGLAVSHIPADEDHPYGHGKAEPLSAAAIALLIIAAGMGIAALSIMEIVSPRSPPAPFTLVVLLVTVLAKEALSRRVRRVGRDIGSSALIGDAWNQRSDAIVSAMAAVGISVALIGGPKWQGADDWAALVASAIIAAGGIRLLVGPVQELMDREPAGDLRERCIAVAAAQPDVMAVEKTWMRKVGAAYFFDVHIEVDPDLTVRASHEIAHRVAEAVRAAFPQVANVTVHVEPHAPGGGDAGPRTP